jgi:hypothetical protein
MTRIDETRTNLQTRGGELLTQTREAGEGLLTAARSEAKEWRTYLLGRRFVFERELRTLSSPTAFERRALELAAESLEAAHARIETRLVELRAMELAKQRVQAKKARPKKRAVAKKRAAPAPAPVAHAKAKSAAPKSRGPKRIEFPAPN